jgi:hypothetical protein
LSKSGKWRGMVRDGEDDGDWKKELCGSVDDYRDYYL